MDKLLQLIKHGEGYESRPYQCTAKKMTWGYGRCYETYPLTLNERFKVASICKMMVDPKEQWTLDQTTFILSNIDNDKCKAVAEYFLADVLGEILQRMPLRFESWWNKTDEVRQAVWIDWAYNMGLSEICSWSQTSQMMVEKKYSLIANKAYEYKWAFDVGRKAPSPQNPAGQRAYYICKMMATGNWPDWIT